MGGNEWLAERFEENRGHLRAVAYRMLGSGGEADDAVQETWLRLSRTDVSEVENLGGWLTTVAARVCLDMLRARNSRREESLDEPAPQTAAVREIPAKKMDPEQEAVLADAVGAALLVVLDRLEPAERLAFVLHDMFAVPFEEIAPIVGRSEDAARQLASRARRRVHGAAAPSGTSASLAEHRKIAESFLGALRAGDFNGLLKLLDPDVVVRVDHAAGRPGAPPREIRGAENWARGAIAYAQAIRMQFTQAALVDGAVGLVMAQNGKLSRAIRLTIEQGKIARVDIVTNPASVEKLDVSVLED
ncbi:MAG TPA: sigma-70 family RNA polymerase sigma factor [Candidatus Acidoferrales bacterium]|nr:sigma-70 family RNA polymerase sigma factor [Candidatus Acidoferrales bacterium]